MSNEQRKEYEIQKNAAKKIYNRDIRLNYMFILAAINKMRRICVSPSLENSLYEGESPKIELLKQIVNEKIANNHKILIFSQWTDALDIIESTPLNKIKHERIDGATPSKERLAIVERFNTDSSIKYVLMSLKAGGTGLNLIGADTAIHLEPFWNMAAEDQATDRCHRIGQTNIVEVIKLVCLSSVEEKVVEIQNSKKELSNLMVDEEGVYKKLSPDDILKLLD